MKYIAGDRIEFSLIYQTMPKYKDKDNAIGIITLGPVPTFESIRIKRTSDQNTFWRPATYVILISRKQIRRT